MNTAHFTAQAAALVARNDRRAWLRGLIRSLQRHGRRATVAWSAVAVASVVIYLFPPYARFYA